MTTIPIYSCQSKETILDHIFLHLAGKVLKVFTSLEFLVVDKFQYLIRYVVDLPYVFDTDIGLTLASF